MKTFIKILLILLVLGGLGAAVLLVMKNQETRRGAALILLQPQFIPDKKVLNVGDTFTVAFGVNADTNKLTAIEAKVRFDKTKLTLLGMTPVIREASVGATASGVGQPLFRQSNNVLSPFSLDASNQYGIVNITGISLKMSGSGESAVVDYDENSPETLSSGYVAVMRMQFRVDGGSGTHTFLTVDPSTRATIYTDNLAEVMNFDVTQGADYTISGGASGSFYVRGGCDSATGKYSCTATTDSGIWNGWQGWYQSRFDTLVDEGAGAVGWVTPTLPFDSGGIWPNNQAGTQFRLVGYKGTDRWARNFNYDVGTTSWSWGQWEYTPSGLGTTAFGGAPDTITRFWSKPDRSEITIWATKGNRMWEMKATAVGETGGYTNWTTWKEVNIFQIPGVTGPYDTMTRFPANPENTIQGMVVTQSDKRYSMRYTWNGATNSWLGTSFEEPIGLWPVQDQPNKFDFFARIPFTLDQKTQLGVLVRGIYMWTSKTNWVATYTSLNDCQDGGSACVAASPTPTTGASACTDSDNGRNYGAKGETCQDGSCSSDSCTAAGLLKEYYCDDSGNKTVEQVGCGDGSHCDDGACVADNGTTNAAQPTDTPNGNDSYLNMKVVFSGMTANPQCAGPMASSLIVLGDGVSAVYTDVTPVRDSSVTDKVVYQFHKLLTGFSQRNGVAVFLKGPKHLQMKYGVSGQSDFYNKAGGELTLTAGADSPNNDFTGYPELPGDINQDGVIDGRDFALLKEDNLVLKRVGAGGYLTTDLDGDCVVTGHDMQLFRASLADKQSQLY